MQIGVGGGLAAVDTHKATRALIKAGESIMEQNKSAMERLSGDDRTLTHRSKYEPSKIFQTHSKMFPI
jgi:hypothetical protein